VTPFRHHQGIAAPLLRDNIDTDTIIPSREMRTVSRSGLAAGLFAPWRYTDPDARVPDTDFLLNTPAFSGASILIAGGNFGCGSSREHAVWALMESGFRAVLAPSFATIFQNNALRNGLLPVELPRKRIDELAAWVQIDPQNNRLHIDLETCVLHSDATSAQDTFTVNPSAREMLLQGLDEIGLTEKYFEGIAAFEARDRVSRPWVYLAD
jgi:3-isopropylmalate/(R)-2-methylmalate dehydratase small subunit